MPNKVFIFVDRGRKFIAVSCSEAEWHTLLPTEIKAIYEESKTLREFARKLDISPRLGRKALTLAGVNYLRDLYSKRCSGLSCTRVAAENGMKRATLSQLFKEQGYNVPRGKPRRLISQFQLSKAAYELRTINAVARRFKIHWQTAKAVLHSQSLLVTNNGQYRLNASSTSFRGGDLRLLI